MVAKTAWRRLVLEGERMSEACSFSPPVFTDQG